MRKYTLSNCSFLPVFFFISLIIVLLLSGVKVKADPALNFAAENGKPQSVGLNPEDETDTATVSWRLSIPAERMWVCVGNPNSLDAFREKIYTFSSDELSGETSFSYDLKVSDRPYYVMAEKGTERIISDRVWVKYYIRDIQVHSFGTPVKGETFTVESFKDMVPYGSKYKVVSLTWRRYSPSGDFEEDTVLKEGDSYEFLPVKKYAARIELYTGDTSSDRFYYKSDKTGITIGEGQEYRDIILNGGALKADKDNSYTFNSSRLFLWTEPVATEDPAFTLVPDPVTGVDRNTTCKYIKWEANFNPHKIQLFRSGVYIKDLPSCTTLVKSSEFGSPHKIRMYYGNGENDYVESPVFKVCWLIDKINVTGYVKPEANKTSTTGKSLSVFGGDGYEVYTLTWVVRKKGKAAEVKTKPFTFERGSNVYGRIYLKAKSKYTFNDYYAPGSITINDKINNSFDNYSIRENGDQIRLTTKYVSLKKLYYINFYPGNEDGRAGTMAGETVEEGDAYTLPVPEFYNSKDASRSVVKWKIGDEEYDIHSKIYPKGNIDVYAVWGDQPLVTVTFNAGTHAHGETVVKQYPNQTGVYIHSGGGGFLTLDEDCVFENWKIIYKVGENDQHESTLSQEAAKSIAVEIQGNTIITLNGQEGPRCTLKFDANGGEGSMDEVKVPLEKEYTLPECAFTREGYKFLYWDVYPESEPEAVPAPCFPGETVVLYKNLVAKAVWKENPRIVSFDLNGSSDKIPDIEAEKGDKIILPGSDEFTPPAGKQFLKWQLPDKSTVLDGAEIEIESDICLKALWVNADEGISTVYVSKDNNSFETFDSIKSGSKYTLPDCFYTAPEGKKFYKWMILHLGQRAAGETIDATEDIFIYPIWIPVGEDHVTISFDPDGGVGEMEDVNVKKDSEYTLPECSFEAPEGKIFDCWLLPDNSQKPAGEKITATADTVIKATWKDNGKSPEPGGDDNGNGSVSNNGSGGGTTDNTVKEDIIPDTKDPEGKDIKVTLTYTKEVSYNGLKHEWTGGKKKKNTVNDVIVNVDSSMSEFADPVLKFKNNRDSNAKNADNPNKQPYYIISFKPKKGMNDKAKKKIIKDINKEIKKQKKTFTINQADLKTVSDMKLTIKNGKVKKAAVLIDGRTLKLKKSDYSYVINPDNTVTITAAGEKSNFTGTWTGKAN